MLFFIFILIIILLLFIVIITHRKNSYLTHTLSDYEKIIEEQGKKNHEYNNQLLILQGYINNKKKLNEYLKTIIEDHKTGQNFEIRQLSHLPQGGIKNLIYYKVNKMNQLSIKNYLYVHEDVKDVIKNLGLKDYKDLTKMLGVLIDNAIDGSRNSKDKEVSIDFKMDDKYLLIVITNSINEDVDIKKIGQKRYSSKGKGHGFGLLIIKDILKNNNKIEMVSENINNSFSQTILVEIK